ncbi:hypothetical protein J5N97_011858 [Dioscorea zingiberensis]|uniref:Retrovirus-related Pol polyprotein from transposon TNT 1-94-like beta-barrel domain-containing protein n=1 Tax=Dioscorea zingiberensis TaxID=325984 RepID=A0A9D5D3U8_9LILI|nr:hypothetical protein J5N97_011858 [Dioscorea zingiberensis]
MVSEPFLTQNTKSLHNDIRQHLCFQYILPFYQNSSAGLLPTSFFNHAINVKLNRDNYLLLKAQMMPYLRGQQLLRFVDGSYPFPEANITTTTESGATQVQNPEYKAWCQHDQQVLSVILSSLFEEILTHMLFLTTSSDVWSALEKMFSSRSRARIMQIRLQLSNLQKRYMTATDYFHQVKILVATLSAIGKPLQDEEVISYMLAGLGSEYDPLVTSITTRTEPISINDLYAHLLSFEMRLEHHNSTFQMNSSANTASRGRGTSRGRSRGRGGRGAPSQGGNNTGNHSGYRGGGRNFHSSRPNCQVCGKAGHTALKCYHRFDHSYQAEESANFAGLTTTPSYQIDPNWYMDSGATDHITSDLDRLTVKEKYGGGDQVQVGNGSGLNITHVGHSRIHTPKTSLF